MKNGLLSLALVALLCAASLSLANAQAKSVAPASALHSIRENATAAQENARIFQWVRVNRQVDRVVDAARKVEKALAADSTLAKQREEFHAAVSALRSARLAREPERIAEAAHQLIALCDALMKK